MYAVQAEGLGKSYRIYARPARRVLEALTLGRIRGHREVWALRGIDLALSRGMVLGVCGANGAGKTTLLRILSGTTAPSEGRYRTRGRVASLLELGTGFQPEMSGRANLLHSGVLLGHSRREMERRMPEIIEFSELGVAIDAPLRTYSSGMGMRLGFSVAVALEPEILILDEIFAVGDVAFQRKCAERIERFRRQNRTILFCSHSVFDLRKLCDEAIWLRDGKVAARGETVAVTGEYLTSARAAEDAPRSRAASAEGPRVEGVTVRRTGSDQPAREIHTGDSIEIIVRWSSPSVQELSLGIGLVREDRTLCLGVASHDDGVSIAGRAGRVTLQLPSLSLLSGRYHVVVWLMDARGVHRHEEHVADDCLVVRASTRHVGVYAPEHAWTAASDPAGPAGGPA